MTALKSKCRMRPGREGVSPAFINDVQRKKHNHETLLTRKNCVIIKAENEARTETKKVTKDSVTNPIIIKPNR